jgi:acetylornithine deacetylase/succinyl-diaminopimelate desuccinylase-like protein
MRLDKVKLLHRARESRDELVKLCLNLVKVPSDNPPGDTSQLASYIREYLMDRGADVRAYEPQRGVVSLVSATGEASPHLSFTSGGTDCRFWRLRGVPAVSYGLRVYGIGGVDEHISVDDLLTTALVNMGTTVGFLNHSEVL